MIRNDIKNNNVGTVDFNTRLQVLIFLNGSSDGVRAYLKYQYAPMNRVSMINMLDNRWMNLF